MEATFSHRRSMRHRRSLHEGTVSTRSLRRLERHSLAAAPSQSLQISMLEHLHVQFVKAYVPASTLSRPRYVMKVTNLALQQSWEMVRPFKDFHDLKEDLLRVLDHGHLCKSNCPWIYMFATHNFPRRHIFRSRQPSVVAERLAELETFLNTLLRAIRDDRSFGCSISARTLPKIVYDFLYEGMVFDQSDFNNTILEDRVSIGNAVSDMGIALPEEACTICLKTLKHTDSYHSLSRASDSATVSSDSSVSSGTGSGSDSAEPPPIVSVTTLTCGHRYHDECILEKLNQHLECPLCVDAQAA